MFKSFHNLTGFVFSFFSTLFVLALALAMLSKLLTNVDENG